MDAERFAHYIKNPAHLYQVTYTELKSLVLQYPYCQNLRYLLLKKSILENHKEKEQNLKLAATYSADRNFLYYQIKEGDSFASEADNFVLKEDYLELKSIHPVTEDTKASDQAVDVPDSNATPILEDSSPKLDDDLSLEEQASPTVEPAIDELTQSDEDAKASVNEVDWYNNSSWDEDEIEDITEELDSEEGLVLDLSNAKTDEEAPKPSETDEEASESDEAISIEDLIEMDSLTPFERLKKETEQKAQQEKDIPREHENTMKKQEFDFEELNALIEQTKQEVKLEITNEEDLEVKEETPAKPSKKSSFGNWLKKFPPPEFSEEDDKFILPEPVEKKKKRKKPKKKAKGKGKKAKPVFSKEKSKGKEKHSDKKTVKAKQIAQQSLKDDEGIASETLAKLLVKQENYEKAILMYQRLSLIFPEKSGYFAEQIENLKKLL